MKIISKKAFHRTFKKMGRSISSTCILKYQIVALVFIIGSCHKRSGPPKFSDSCEIQYTTSKWLNIGDSLVVPACPDSVSITLLQRDNSINFNTQIKMVNRGFKTSDTSWVDEHGKFWIMTFKLKIERFTDGAVLLRVWYNYAL